MLTLALFMLLAAADPRPGLRVSPRAGFAPLRILLTAELKGGADCPNFEGRAVTDEERRGLGQRIVDANRARAIDPSDLWIVLLGI